MSRPTTDECLVQELVEAARGPFSANTIAAGVGGQHHRADVAALARDPEGLLLLRVFEHQQARRRRVVWGMVGLAACALVGILVIGVHRGPAAPPASAANRLAAAVEGLRTQHPKHFADFALATEEALTAPSGVMRGGAVWKGPSGKVLAAPAGLSWRNPEGTRRMRVTLRGPGVGWRKDVSGESVEAPKLGPGRFVVTLVPLDGFARQTVRRAFVVASPEERMLYGRARDAWSSTTSPDLHDLVEAHYALQHGYLASAREAALRAHQSGGGIAELAAPLLAYLAREP